jgi:hypothetical protein
MPVRFGMTADDERTYHGRKGLAAARSLTFGRLCDRTCRRFSIGQTICLEPLLAGKVEFPEALAWIQSK